MTYEEKLQKIHQLIGNLGVDVKMRRPGDWYASASCLDVGGDGFLTGAYGNGGSPEAAVEDLWHRYTTLPEDRYIVIGGNSDGRRHARWDGNDWAELPLPKTKE